MIGGKADHAGWVEQSSYSDGHAPIQLFQAINSSLPGVARLRDGYLTFSFFSILSPSCGLEHTNIIRRPLVGKDAAVWL